MRETRVSEAIYGLLLSHSLYKYRRNIISLSHLNITIPDATVADVVAVRVLVVLVHSYFLLLSSSRSW